MKHFFLNVTRRCFVITSWLEQTDERKRWIVKWECFLKDLEQLRNFLLWTMTQSGVFLVGMKHVPFQQCWGFPVPPACPIVYVRWPKPVFMISRRCNCRLRHSPGGKCPLAFCLFSAPQQYDFYHESSVHSRPGSEPSVGFAHWEGLALPTSWSWNCLFVTLFSKLDSKLSGRPEPYRSFPSSGPSAPRGMWLLLSKSLLTRI